MNGNACLWHTHQNNPFQNVNCWICKRLRITYECMRRLRPTAYYLSAAKDASPIRRQLCSGMLAMPRVGAVAEAAANETHCGPGEWNQNDTSVVRIPQKSGVSASRFQSLGRNSSVCSSVWQTLCASRELLNYGWWDYDITIYPSYKRSK